MAKLHFTGQAGAALTFENKYQVETDSVVDVEDKDVNSLLATGLFEEVKETKPSDDSKANDDSKKSKSS